MKKNIKGFTLIELMIVMTVIAILAAMVLFGLGAAQKSARDVQRESNMRAVQSALQAYASDHNGGYPPQAAATWNSTAGNLFDATAGTGYLGQYITRLTDPGCGTGTVVNLLTTGTACTGVTYTYTFGANAAATSQCKNTSGYYLTLQKESGGSIEFCSPQ